MRSNKYAGTCEACGNRVPPRSGFLSREDGRWTVRHAACGSGTSYACEDCVNLHGDTVSKWLAKWPQGAEYHSEFSAHLCDGCADDRQANLPDSFDMMVEDNMRDACGFSYSDAPDAY